MVRDYFKDGKEITRMLLEHLKATGVYRDDLFYSIDICSIEDGRAEVIVGNAPYTLEREQEGWQIAL